MLPKQLLNIFNNPKVISVLKTVGWIAAIVAIVLTNMLMKGQEISFVYNNF